MHLLYLTSISLTKAAWRVDMLILLDNGILRIITLSDLDFYITEYITLP